MAGIVGDVELADWDGLWGKMLKYGKVPILKFLVAAEAG